MTGAMIALGALQVVLSISAWKLLTAWLAAGIAAAVLLGMAVLRVRAQRAAAA